jgi:hypothetical protein
MALHPAPGCFPLLLSDLRCMQGELLAAAAARTGNSDEPLPLTLLPVPCSRAHTTFITTQRWRLVHISPHSVCRLVISPVRATPSPLTHTHPLAHPPTAGCRLAVLPARCLALLCCCRWLLASSPPPPPPPPADTSSLFPSRACAWVCVGAAPPHKCSAHQPAPPS